MCKAEEALILSTSRTSYWEAATRMEEIEMVKFLKLVHSLVQSTYQSSTKTEEETTSET